MAIEQNAYQRIAKTTTLMGGSSVISILLGIVRSKALAVLLGPSGIGLMSIYSSVMATTVTVAGMGLSKSGVRQISEARSATDQQAIASVRVALRWATFFLAGIGALVLFLFRVPIAEYLFGNAEQAWAIALLGIGAFVSIVSGSQMALLQGLRKIGDLARINVWGSVIGTIAAIGLVFWRGEQAVAPLLVLVALTTFVFSWHYSRKVPMLYDSFSMEKVAWQIRQLLKLGLVFMSTAFMVVGTQFAVRLILQQSLGLEAVGYFQAAWAVSMLYVNFILQAMSTDYYPHLTSLIENQNASNQLVNEQAEFALLLAAPIVIGMVTFAPLVLWVLYSPAFAVANNILQWQTAGVLLKVATWPIGYIVLAKGMGKTFFSIELGWNLLYLLLVWIGVRLFGLTATGIGFFATYFVIFIVTYIIVVRVNRFTYQLEFVRLLVGSLGAVLSVLLLGSFSPVTAYVAGGILAIAFAVYSVRRISLLLGKTVIQGYQAKLRSLLEFRGPSRGGR
jgi:antigen flippase